MRKYYKRALPKDEKEAIEEAIEYFNNAKEILENTPVEYGIYKDAKRVKEAAGIAYLSALRAIDSYLLHKGIPPAKLPTNVEKYKDIVYDNFEGEVLASFLIVYQNLHILAYYRSGVGVGMVNEGMNNVKKLIDKFSEIIKKNDK